MNLRRVVVVTTTRHDDTAPRSFGAAVSQSHNFTPSHYNIRRELSYFTLYLKDCSTFCFLTQSISITNTITNLINSCGCVPRLSLLPYSPSSSSLPLLSRCVRLAWRSCLAGWFTDTEPDLSELHAQALLHFNFKLCRARACFVQT